MNNYEQSTISDATAFSLNGKIYTIPKEAFIDTNTHNLSLRLQYDNWSIFNFSDLDIIGIKPLKKKNIIPIEFEAKCELINTEYYPNMDVVLKLPDSLSNAYMAGKIFKCVEIIENNLC